MPGAVKKGAANKPPKGATNGQGAEGEEEEEEEEEGEPKLSLADVNKAIDARLSRFVKKTLPKVLEGSLTSALTSAGLVKAKPGEGAEGEEEEEEEEGGEQQQGAGAGGGEAPAGGKAARTAAQPAAQPAAPARSPAEDKRYRKLQKELADMKAAQAAEAAKRAREEEVATLSTLLPGLNVRPEMIGPLTTYLRAEDSGRMVRRNAEQKLIFVGRDEDGDEEEMPLKEGLASWLGTDAGKVYVAPKGAGGSGATAGGKPPGRTGGGNSAAELDNALFGMFAGSGG